MVGKILSAIVGALLLTLAIKANSTTINWEVTGPVGPLTAIGGGTDVELLAGSTITLSITVGHGVYGDLFGALAFAPILTGDITISGSGIAANNATHPLTFPFVGNIPPSTPPYGYLPLLGGVFDSTLLPVATTLPSSNILTLGHSIFAPTPSATAAVPGDPISAMDFFAGPGPDVLTVAIQSSIAPPFPAITQYQTTSGTYSVSEMTSQVSVPGTLLLYGLGLACLGWWRKESS